jgi:hypothetical protein
MVALAREEGEQAARLAAATETLIESFRHELHGSPF